MRRLFVVAALLACLEAQAGPKKETRVDMTAAKNIFIGWVGVSPDDWTTLGYADKQSWVAVVDQNNQAFQQLCSKALVRRQITGAKGEADQSADGQDLHVKFSDVRFDTDSYRLYLSIHFVDPKSGSELASVPLRSYRAGHFSVDSCLRGALEKVSEKLQQEIMLSRQR
jgi:hypothetical protein